MHSIERNQHYVDSRRQSFNDPAPTRFDIIIVTSKDHKADLSKLASLMSRELTKESVKELLAFELKDVVAQEKIFQLSFDGVRDQAGQMLLKPCILAFLVTRVKDKIVDGI